ncbi:hypothetical protein NQ314_019150 [Rhamnusium bicolor]|uniref:Uncharacterized protein n=1 Tax=Rhamnusium bicolor TaxID=1586634 RepID=A0AAV8WQA1_9CUCU|nr:hypothetical protein NQ314_019150 [Rhamnusium bicolor]
MWTLKTDPNDPVVQIRYNDISDSEDLSDSNEAKMVKQRKKQAMKKHLPFHQISETEPTPSTSKEDMEVEVSESEEWNSASNIRRS